MHFFDLIANKTLTRVLFCLIMHVIGIIMHGRKTGSGQGRYPRRY